MKKIYEAPRVKLEEPFVKDVITLSCEDSGDGAIVLWPGMGSGLNNG